jgi:hypothetical protein
VKRVPCYASAMTDAQSRRSARAATWTSKVYREPDVHDAMEADDLAEWAAMSPLERLALTWELSLQQEGITDDPASARLPRSAYRVERH